MPRFPNINFPFPYYYNRNPYSSKSSGFNQANHNISECLDTNNFQNPKLSPYNSFNSNTNSHQNFLCVDKKNKSNSFNNDYLFDLFGLKIYTDDVLLISLIYFLYSEGVKDECLFIVLILLLLS